MNGDGDLVKASASTVDPSVVVAAANAEAEKATRRWVTPEDVKAAARSGALRVAADVLHEALDLTAVP